MTLSLPKLSRLTHFIERLHPSELRAPVLYTHTDSCLILAHQQDRIHILRHAARPLRFPFAGDAVTRTGAGDVITKRSVRLSCA